jgi:flagellar biogenesis protein FliO
MDLWESMIRMTSALAVVLALMFVLVAVARRMGAGRMFSTSGNQLIQVLGSSYIGPRKTITLVSVAGELLVVGATATDLVPLGRLPRRTHVGRTGPIAVPPGSSTDRPPADSCAAPTIIETHGDSARSGRGGTE